MKKLLFLTILIASTNSSAQIVVSTFAGSGTNLSINGTGTNASFNTPLGLVRDSNGNLLITELLNHTIKKITPDGTTTSFAGSGIVGFSNSTNGLNATFNFPAAMTIDANNTIYLVDQNNNAIRKITATGVVTTLAGLGSDDPISLDGFGTNAGFNIPSSICIDASGTNLYVTEFGGSKVRKIVIATQQVTTLAGTTAGFANGIGSNAQFSDMFGIAIDPTQGFLYVSERGNKKIRKIEISIASISTFVGNNSAFSSDGIGTAAGVAGIYELTIDTQGNLYFADADNGNIRKCIPSGVVTTITLSITLDSSGYQDGAATGAKFSDPQYMCFDNSGNIFVADYGNRRIRKLSNVTLNSANVRYNNLKFSVYPNPASSILNIEMESEIQSVEIFTLQGQRVQTTTSTIIQLNNLNSGVYIIRIKDSDNNVGIKKLVIK